MSKDSRAKYYQEKKATKKVCDRYQDPAKEEKEKKRQCRCERHKNLHGDERERFLSTEKNNIR